MFLERLRAQGVTDPAVIRAMESVPREVFLPDNMKGRAGEDCALPIECGQTISQPSLVAFMTQVLIARDGGDAASGRVERVLEIGTGSGYQAAILSRVVREVFSLEILPELADRARATLALLGIGNVHVRMGDGHAGWVEEAPFDGIIVTCAPDRIPPSLVEQLRDGGRLVIPVGPSEGTQGLFLLEKIRAECGGGQQGSGFTLRQTYLEGVRFVPMTGGAGL